MDITIPEIMKENAFTFGFALTFALLGVAVKVVKGLINFYEEVLIKRYFNRLNTLNEHVITDSKMSQYINSLKENEVFRLASGIKASPEKINLLMDVYILGVASNNDLKRLSPYLQPINEQVRIDVNWFDKLQFTYSLLAALSLFIMGMMLGNTYFVGAKGIDSFVGLVLMTFLLLLAAIVGKDYRTFRILKRVRARLLDLDRVFNPTEEIVWKFIGSFQKKWKRVFG